MNFDINILLSPPLAFFLFLIVSAGLYLFGRMIGQPAVPEPGKNEPYACGENFRAEKFIFGYHKFYIAAVFFTIMHVAVLTVATVPGGINAYKGLGYLVAIGMSVFVMFADFD